MKDRHENSVKNRYTSIIKSLKKTKKHINFDDINEVIAAFKKLNEEIMSPTKKLKHESDMKMSLEKLPLLDLIEEELPNEKNKDITSKFFKFKEKQSNTCQELQADTSQLSKNNSDSLKSPEIPLFDKILNETANHETKINDPELFPINFDLIQQPFDISNFNLPNIYNIFQTESVNANNLNGNNIKRDEKEKRSFLIRQENSIDVEELSQKMSSMSISDQLLMEANKILAGLSSQHTVSSLSQGLLSSLSSLDKSFLNQRLIGNKMESNNASLLQNLNDINANNPFDINVLFPLNTKMNKSRTSDIDVFIEKIKSEDKYFSPYQSPTKHKKKKVDLIA